MAVSTGFFSGVVVKTAPRPACFFGFRLLFDSAVLIAQLRGLMQLPSRPQRPLSSGGNVRVVATTSTLRVTSLLILAVTATL